MPKVVAIVNDANGEYIDECWNWQSAQQYALYNGYYITAIDDDGSMSREDIQQLCDAETDRYNDCYGVT